MTDKKYCIQLAECDGNSKEVYSFDEIEIGTWVDGKPIYRKVISGKLANDSGDNLIFASILDLKIDRLISLNGSMSHNDNGVQIVFPISYNKTSGLLGAVNMFYDVTTGNVNYHLLNNKGYYSGATAYVIIEYTKK